MSAILAGLWFTTGLFTALTALAFLWPWRSRCPRWSSSPAVKWSALGALVVVIAACRLAASLQGAEPASTAVAESAAPGPMTATAPDGHGGDSLQSALKKLEARLRSGNGSATDWSLLAQTYEYLGRTSEAQNARARHVVADVATGETANALWPAGLVEAVEGAAPRSEPAPDVAEETRGSAPPPGARVSAHAQELLNTADKARAARDYPLAKSAYDQLVALHQMDAQSWADFADVVASLNGGHLDGLPQQYIETALKLSPTNEKALWLQASAAHEDQHYALAISTWTRLLTVIPAGSPQAKVFAANLAEDQHLLSQEPASETLMPANTPARPGAAQLNGEVRLAATLGSTARSGLSLFIVARSINSPGAPVAVVRVKTGVWPVAFHLDDSLAMIPERKLSTAGPVTIEARISQSGAAASAPGDLASQLVTVQELPAQSVQLLIDHVVH